MDTRPEDPLERRRDELRRLVYGTPEGASEQIHAELLEIERAMAAAVREREVVVVTPVDASDPGLDETDELADPAPVAPGPARLRWSTGRRGVALAGAVVVIAATVLALGPLREVADSPRGLSIFDREQTAQELRSADRISAAADLRPEATVALRSLGRVFGHDFWAYRNDDLVCLLTQRLYWFDWVQRCVTVRQFEANGLARRIPADDVRADALPGGVQSDDVIVVEWGPKSIVLRWRIAMPSEGS
jgi:hypothetical protein